MTDDPGSLLPIALQAAATAADLIRTRPATITEKSDRDLVSDVDLAIEREVRAFLATATPDIGFLGEEEGGADPATGWLWTLDPIDGTSNYAHRLPLCAVSLALLRDGRPVLGVIEAPLLGERYHAAEGHGAWAGDRRLAASTATSLRDAIVAIGDYATGAEAGRKNEARLAATVALTSRVHRIRMLGSAAIDLAWIADGRLDASITLTNTPWDMAAGVIIAREAGATVADTDGTPYVLQSRAVIAATEPLLSQLLPLLQVASSPETDGHRSAQLPHASLDMVLSRARNLIFEFDGPGCALSDAMPADAANQLRSLVKGEVPAPVAATRDPFAVLAWAAQADQAAADKADRELSGLEIIAADSAHPAGYIHETLAACRDSGRTASIVSRRSAAAVAAFLDRHDLTDHIQYVLAAGSYPPGHLQTLPHLLEDVFQTYGTEPGACAVITVSPDSVSTVRIAGAEVIGYAATSEHAQKLASAGASCTVQSLADLTLRLRARPLPN